MSSFPQGLSGLNASSKNLEVIGNNIANANTYGAKTSRAEFSHVYTAALGQAGTVQAGAGVRTDTVSQQFTQGNITDTGISTDLAISGDGFFQVSDGINPTMYTRNGQFKVNNAGELVNNDGLHLMGYGVNASGQIMSGTLQALRVPTASVAPRVTSTAKLEMNLDSGATLKDPALLAAQKAADGAYQAKVDKTYAAKASVGDAIQAVQDNLKNVVDAARSSGHPDAPRLVKEKADTAKILAKELVDLGSDFDPATADLTLPKYAAYKAAKDADDNAGTALVAVLPLGQEGAAAAINAQAYLNAAKTAADSVATVAVAKNAMAAAAAAINGAGILNPDALDNPDPAHGAKAADVRDGTTLVADKEQTARKLAEEEAKLGPDFDPATADPALPKYSAYFAAKALDDDANTALAGFAGAAAAITAQVRLNLATSAAGEAKTAADDLATKTATLMTASRDAASFDPANTTTYNYATSQKAYDAQGQEVTLSYYFQKGATDPVTNQTSWNVFVSANGQLLKDKDTSTQPLRLQLDFPAGGKAPTGTSSFALDIPSVTTGTGVKSLPLTVQFDLSKATQYGSPTAVTKQEQDGYAAGNVSSINVQEDGTVMAVYSNGKSFAAGQVELAKFINPQGLQPLSGNLWAGTPASGDPVRGTPANGVVGKLRANALEESNVDIAAELVNMITAQRSYQANAQTIKTQDQVMQTLINLR